MLSSLKSFARNTVFYNFYKIYKAKIALQLYDNPSKDMFVIGIT
jgi:hypothetical protein